MRKRIEITVEIVVVAEETLAEAKPFVLALAETEPFVLTLAETEPFVFTLDSCCKMVSMTFEVL